MLVGVTRSADDDAGDAGDASIAPKRWSPRIARTQKHTSDACDDAIGGMNGGQRRALGARGRPRSISTLFTRGARGRRAYRAGARTHRDEDAAGGVGAALGVSRGRVGIAVMVE